MKKQRAKRYHFQKCRSKDLLALQVDVTTNKFAKGNEVGLSTDIFSGFKPGIGFGVGTKFDRNGVWQGDYNLHAGFSWPPTVINASFEKDQ